jgi:phosphoglycolate phosphatase-like HAD superfamily hydrolase
LRIVSLIEEFGVSPERTIYIGDTDHDVRQAKKAGVLSAVVQTGGQAVKHLDKIRRRAPAFPVLRYGQGRISCSGDSAGRV